MDAGTLEVAVGKLNALLSEALPGDTALGVCFKVLSNVTFKNVDRSEDPNRETPLGGRKRGGSWQNFFNAESDVLGKVRHYLVLV